MERLNLDQDWCFRRGLLDSIGILESDPGVYVNLPHDGMIGLDVTKDAPAKHDSGYYPGDVCNYTRYVDIPQEWQDDAIGLQFDGVMMHASVEINGCKVGEHHYGYSPFYVDITDFLSFGAQNRITININTGVQPSSRWYTGSGLFRSVTLCHGKRVHILPDGIYLYTKEVTDDIAFVGAQIDLGNQTLQNHMVEVEVDLCGAGDDSGTVVASGKRTIMVPKMGQETANLVIHIPNPKLWDVDNPNLYEVKVIAKDFGVYTTRIIESDNPEYDELSTLFGVRTISVDSVRGLRINGKTTKLKGGCIHHDNGLLGAASLYECEARKVQKLKEIGFNAIRTAHNPPSRVLVEACDRLGMYIFDEAFDAWGIAKRTGDYSQHFEAQWEKDITAYVKRDRVHPSVIMWSIGNEIPERGGLNQGYTLATKLANKIHSLDMTRPISNGICSLWAGLDDVMAKDQDQNQNAVTNSKELYEAYTEPFTNGLDVVGYNYMELAYERDHEMFPERVVLGSENFPKEIGFRWPVVEASDYVIGDFTWTAWDYIGEAGIGKSIFVEEGDPLIEKGPWAIMPPETSPFPWKLANDADVDITGLRRPQGDYRSVVWGSNETYLYSVHPANYGKIELLSMWGFPDLRKCWNYGEYIGKPIKAVVFSKADEVELILNGNVLERKPVVKDGELPNSVSFDLVYETGVLEAVGYCDGKQVSSDKIITSGKPSTIILKPEKEALLADGHDLVFIQIDIVDDEGRLVTDAQIEIKATLSGQGDLTGFGTGNPCTADNYTVPETTTYNGHAMAVIRSGYEQGSVTLSVESDGLKSSECIVSIQ